MRIIKSGIKPSERLYQVTCTTCKTEFEFKQSEATFYDDQREGSYYSIKCPICNDSVFATYHNLVKENKHD